MNLWRKLRQQDRIEALQDELAAQTRELVEMTSAREDAESELSRERDKRIGFESLAAERRQEIDRMAEEVRFLRGEVERVMSERLKSLDALNQKLMEPKTEAPAPDIKQFHRESVEKVGIQAMHRIRQIHNQMDMAILTGLHPKFAKKGAALPMNEPLPTQGQNDSAD